MALTAVFILYDSESDFDDVKLWRGYLRALEGSIYEATLIEVKGKGRRVNLQAEDETLST
jgi:hypothetical protein